MPYPSPTPDDIAHFRERGFLVVRDAIDPTDLNRLADCCQRITDNPLLHTTDAALAGKPAPVDTPVVLQSTLEMAWIGWQQAPFAVWVAGVAAALEGHALNLLFNQVLSKAPGCRENTIWHQDEACWEGHSGGPRISCWIPMADVDVDSGCMHFLDGAHRQGALGPGGYTDAGQAGLGQAVAGGRVVPCPLSAGSVTFHDGWMPHMAPPNQSNCWRHVVIVRFRLANSGDSDVPRINAE